MPSIIDFTDKNFIKWIEVTDKFRAIEELTIVFEDTKVCSDTRSLIQALNEREQIMSTGIGFGIAIPHAKINTVKEMAFSIGISKHGIDFDSMDGLPVHLIILVAAGEKQHKEYLRLMSNIMSIIKKDDIKEKIINAESADDIVNILTSGSGS